MSIVEEDVDEHVFNDPMNSVSVVHPIDLCYYLYCVEVLVSQICNFLQNWLDRWRICIASKRGQLRRRVSSTNFYKVCAHLLLLFCILCCFVIHFYMVSMFCLHRMGGALKTVQSVDHLPVIGLDETVHDLSAHEDPTDEPLPSVELSSYPDPLKVQCLDDIICVRAAVLYETCLRQLFTLMKLPVDRCTGGLRTGLVCDSVAPFNINITYKGTAMIAEWVSPGNNNIIHLVAIPCTFLVTNSVA